MFRRHAQLLETGMTALHAAVELLESLPEKTPLVVHVFSNGGGTVLEALRNAMAEVAAGTFKGEPRDAVALRMLNSRIKAGIFDSSPCYLYAGPGVRAISEAVPILPVRWLIQMSLLLLIGASTLISSSDPREEYWAHWARGPAAPGCTQLYIYSPLDTLCDVVKLEELIAARKHASDTDQSTKGGKDGPVSTLRFEDTMHVAHLRKHPRQYADACRWACGLESPS